MKYKIVLYPSEAGYAVSCPLLPGCWSQGATREEAIANIQDAIGDYLAALQTMLSEGNMVIEEMEEAQTAA